MSMYLVEIVVLPNELLQLRLNIDDLRARELELHHGHPRLLEVLQEADLGRLEEHQTAALAVGTTGRSADTVNVVARVIWGVELDDPVDGGDLGENGQSSLYKKVGQGRDKHQGHEQQRRYRSGFPAWRCRTRRKCWCVFAAFACRAAPAREGQCS